MTMLAGPIGGPINDRAILFCKFELTDASPDHPGLNAVVEIEGTPQNIRIAYRDEQGTIIAETTVELFAGKLVARIWDSEDVGSDPTFKQELCDTLDTSEPEPEEPRALSEIIQQPDDITSEDAEFPGAKKLADASPEMYDMLFHYVTSPDKGEAAVALLERAQAIVEQLDSQQVNSVANKRIVSR